MLESIGAITLVIGGLYLVLKRLSNREQSLNIDRDLIRNSEKCQKLINEYNEIAISGSRQMSKEELDRKIYKTINDPIERKKAIEKVEQKNEREKKWEAERIVEEKKQMRIRYKYDVEIFEIFDTNQEISKIELIEQIKSKYKVEIEEANSFLNMWRINGLIQICEWNRKHWKIGDALKYEWRKIDQTDLIWEEWLTQQGKVAGPYSQEYQNYRKEQELPF